MRLSAVKATSYQRRKRRAEARDRERLRRKRLDQRRNVRDVEHVLRACVRVDELQRAVRTAQPGERVDQGPESRAVDVRHALQIENDLP